MDPQIVIEELFALELSDSIHDDARQRLDIVYKSVIGASLEHDFGFVAHCLRGVFALGVQAGQERDALR